MSICSLSSEDARFTAACSEDATVPTEQTILVTGPDLDPEAAALAAQNGFKVVHTPAYPSSETLREYFRKHDPFGIVSRMGRIERTAMHDARSLRVVAKHGAGVDNIDVAAATQQGVLVTRAAGGNAVSVAEHAVAMMMALVKRLIPMDARLRAGYWDKPQHLGREIRGMKVGLVGTGAIGRETARLCRGIGMEVGIFDPYAPAETFRDLGAARHDTLEACLAGSDIVSLHCPLTEETRHLLNARTIALMHQGSYVVNTARGGLIDEAALKEALDSGYLAGAALDTFEVEPPGEKLPLYSSPNAILTPHLGASTDEAEENCAVMAADRSELAAVDGVGDRTARRIEWAVEEPIAGYVHPDGYGAGIRPCRG